MVERLKDLDRLRRALEGCQDLQALAIEYGIPDIFQDNGGKVLQSLIILGLRSKGGREGNDAIDDDGNEYELKTVNLAQRTNPGITTHHHLNLGILAKYRSVHSWYISLYDGIDLQSIYRLTPGDLEPIFSRWERRLRSNGDTPLNNPKIPLTFIRQHGLIVFPSRDSLSSNYLPPSSPLR